MNTVANHFIEKPIVHAMDKVEDAAADAVKSVFHVFSGWFHSSEGKRIAKSVVEQAAKAA